MKLSFTYHLTLFVLKLKGIKKDFSKNPIDFNKIRKADIHSPKKAFFKKYKSRKFNINNSQITEISTNKRSCKLLIFIHGGGFISGPSQIHWDAVKELANKTNHTIWMCDYPKAPENNIIEISKNIDDIYTEALSNYSANYISIIGDSVGGTLATTLVQRLIINGAKLPGKIILISPVMDSSLSNAKVKEIEIKDPMLSVAGILSAKKMCAGTTNLKDQMMSPLYGSFEGFPNTYIFAATNDITYPDEILAIQKMNEAHINLQVFTGEQMPHVWPLLPVMKEAKMALKEIITILKT